MYCQAISVRQLDEILDRGFDGMLVDVRNQPSYRHAHIRGAVYIPYETFERGDGGLPKDKTLIFYCARGGQSMKVCARLSRQGFQTVNLVGGIDHYQGRYLVRG